MKAIPEFCVPCDNPGRECETCLDCYWWSGLCFFSEKVMEETIFHAAAEAAYAIANELSAAASLRTVYSPAWRFLNDLGREFILAYTE